MPKAFICGCSGLALTPEERSFLREERSVGPHPLQAQCRRPRSDSRADPIVSRMRRPGGRSGSHRPGRGQGPAHGAAALAGLPRGGRDRGGSAAVRGGGGGSSDRASDRRRSERSRDHGRLRAGARRGGDGDPCRDRLAGLFAAAGARRRDGQGFRDRPARRRRPSRHQAHAGPRPGAVGQPSRASRRRGRARGVEAGFRAVRGAARPADGDDGACRLQRARRGAAGHDLACRCPRHHARRNRIRRPDHERRRVDEGAARPLRESARRPFSRPDSTSFSTATATSTRRGRSRPRRRN